MLASCGIVAFASDVNVSGTAGSSITWTLYDDGKLVFSGSGKMSDYGSVAEELAPPWYDYKSYITSVVIEDGITYIGEFAFEYLTSLKTVTIADSVTEIGAFAFRNTTSLQSVTIPKGVKYIWAGTFVESGIITVYIPVSVIAILDDAFTWCTKLRYVYYEGTQDDWDDIAKWCNDDDNDYLISHTPYYKHYDGHYFDDYGYCACKYSVVSQQPTTGTPKFVVNDSQATYQWYENTSGDEVLVDGEASSTLTNPLAGKNYVCIATLSDGQTVKSNTIEFEPDPEDNTNIEDDDKEAETGTDTDGDTDTDVDTDVDTDTDTDADETTCSFFASFAGLFKAIVSFIKSLFTITIN